MRTTKEKGFITRESKVRQMAMRTAAAVSVLLASLLFFLIVPVFPREIMVLCAVVLGALAYKAPVPALMLLLVLALPGYYYQLKSVLPSGTSIPVLMVVIVPVLLLGIALVSGQVCGILGVASGVVAAILMLTPFQFLSLPVIIGTALFRGKGTVFRAASAVLIFVILYYPFLAISNGGAPGEAVPLSKLSFSMPGRRFRS